MSLVDSVCPATQPIVAGRRYGFILINVTNSATQDGSCSIMVLSLFTWHNLSPVV